MAVTPNSAILPQTPKSAVAQIQNADGTNLKALVAGGANNSKLSAIVASNTDTNAYTLQVWRNVGGSDTGGTVSGGTNYLICSVQVPASAGEVAGTPPTALLNTTIIPGIALDSTGQPFLYVNSGEFLCIALATGAVASGKVVAAHATVGDF